MFAELGCFLKNSIPKGLGQAWQTALIQGAGLVQMIRKGYYVQISVCQTLFLSGFGCDIGRLDDTSGFDDMHKC